MSDTYLNSISSLIAGSIAAVNSIGNMIDVNEFTSLLTESLTKNLYVSSINERTMLAVVFSKDLNLGLIRFRLKGAIKELKEIFITINEKLESNILKDEDFPFEGVTDKDIDEIFGD
jgi:predicted regulator of Ras-like GTPase activity (Roadblock/LC7/MglB family)